MKRYFLAILATMLLGCFCALGQDAKLLRYRLNVGDTYWIYTESLIALKTNIEQLSGIETEALSETLTLYRVDSISSEGYHMTVSYGSFKMEMKNQAGGTIVIDSEKPLPEGADPGTVMIYEVLNAMVGQSFGQTLTPRGQVTAITGYDQMFRSVLLSIPEITPDQVDAFLAELSSSWNSESFAESFMMTTPEFAQDEVRVGDSWQRSINVAMGTMKMGFDYTNWFSGEGEGVIEITGEGDIRSSEKNTGAEITGVMQMQMELDELSLWLNTGRVDMRISYPIDVPGMDGGEMTVKGNTVLSGGVLTPESQNQ